MGALAAAYANITIFEASGDCLLHKAGDPYQKTGRLAWGNDGPAYAARLHGKVRDILKRRSKSILSRMYGLGGTILKLL